MDKGPRFKVRPATASRLTFVLELVGGLGRLVLDVLHHVVDLGFVLEEEGPHDAGVDQDGTVGGCWGHAPHQEGTLEGERRVFKLVPVIVEICPLHLTHHPLRERRTAAAPGRARESPGDPSNSLKSDPEY